MFYTLGVTSVITLVVESERVMVREFQHNFICKLIAGISIQRRTSLLEWRDFGKLAECHNSTTAPHSPAVCPRTKRSSTRYKFPVYEYLDLFKSVLGPSPELLQALLALVEDLKHIGVVFNPVRQQEVVRDTMGFLVQSFLEKCRDVKDEQTSFNLALLWKISQSYGQPWSDTTTKVHELLKTSVSLFPVFLAFFFF